MDNRLKQDALIEDALRSQTLAPMPRSVTADVMARFQTDKRPALITWHDFGLKGIRYDIGDKLGYVQAIIDFALKNDELKVEVSAYLKQLNI